MTGKKKHLVGGQAVIEGVMIRGSKNITTSVRKNDGSIVSKKEPLPKEKFYKKIFLLRGIFNLIEMLVIGIKTLIWSSNQVLEETEDEEFTIGEVVMLLFTSFGFAIIFFVALPYFLTHIIGFEETKMPILFNLIDGVIKILIFFIYLIAISFMKDVKRLFEYHGAEHKTIHCYEKGKKLTIENVKKYPTLHSRCGTSFIMFVLVVSILIFALIPTVITSLFPSFSESSFWIQRSVLFPIRILFIPVVAGISYELLRISAKYEKFPIFSILIIPGLLVQKITTKEPDDKQIEVAIHALKQSCNEK